MMQINREMNSEQTGKSPRLGVALWALGGRSSCHIRPSPIRGLLWLALLLIFLAQRSTIHSQPAPPNRVLELDGQGSYVELPIAPLQGLKEFTIEAWVKPAQFGKAAAILGVASDLDENALVLTLTQPAARRLRLGESLALPGMNW